MAETCKADRRRQETGWYDDFCPFDGPGLDIGCGRDPVHPDAEAFNGESGWLRWDKAQGDATDMHGIEKYLPSPDFKFRTVYASHIMEHLDRPLDALNVWMSLVAIGGHLIVCVPHRDLYERRRRLPSQFNREHKHFWLPQTCDPPHTFSFYGILAEAFSQRPYGPDPNFGADIRVEVVADGYDPQLDDHQSGEFSIEAVMVRVR